VADAAARLYVLAGTNGAGKSSIAGAMVRERGGDYFNPDEAARVLREANPKLSQTQANSAAWHQGQRLLQRAIAQRLDFAFETTLGGATVAQRLAQAARDGIELHIWYAGLDSPERHLQRIRERVGRGGHDIPEPDVRRRFDASRLHLVQLLPLASTVRVYDNSHEAVPSKGAAPKPWLVLHWERGRIVGPKDLSDTPSWAKPIVAAALAAVKRSSPTSRPA
jgi:predicted ABC-type ATPase